MSILYYLAVAIAPVVMFIVGLRWRLSPPPHRSNGLVYSTELTRKNPDAWAAAHRHCSKLWMRIGVVSGAATVILVKLFNQSLSSFWLWLIVGQMILFCVSVFMVDLLIKTQFGGENK